jgi:protein-L-isoaspartate O-methyltransferase
MAANGLSDARDLRVGQMLVIPSDGVRPLLDQLGAGGRLVAPIGEDELQTLVRIRRVKGVWADRARVILAAMDIKQRILAMQ